MVWGRLLSEGGDTGGHQKSHCRHRAMAPTPPQITLCSIARAGLRVWDHDGCTEH